MAQVIDRTVGANPTGFDMRTELNNIIGALESDNSGSSEPLNTVAGMKWMDTSDSTYYYYKERNHDNTAWVTLFRYTVATKVMEAVSNGIVLQDTAIEIHNATSKATPVDADELSLVDSVSTFTIKKLTWSNLKATLKTYFDTLYQSTLVSGTNIKTINSTSLLGSGNISITETAWTANDSRAKTALNATGEAPIYACRAWVNFDGTGTVAIRASGNVSSITDLGIGSFRANFTTAMQDENYAVSTTQNIPYGANYQGRWPGADSYTISSVGLYISFYGSSSDDYSLISATITR